MEQFFETLKTKKANGELEVAIEQCKKSATSLVRGYVAYGALKGWDCEQLVLRFNKEILDGIHDEETLKKEVAFYYKSLMNIPASKQRLPQKL